MTDGEDQVRTVAAVDRTLTIIEAIYELDGARVTELANHLNLPKSTTHRYLKSLLEDGYLVKDGDQYDLGLRFTDLGHYAQSRKGLYRLAKPIVKRLAEKVDERAQFLVKEHDKLVYVHRTSAERGISADSGIGKQLPIHATAAGKVILAHQSPDDIERILDDYKFTELTPHTITNRNKFYNELEEVRERGFGLNQHETVEGLCSIAVPVMRSNEYALGALSVTGPAHRMGGERLTEEFPDILLGMANELEVKLQYS